MILAPIVALLVTAAPAAADSAVVASPSVAPRVLTLEEATRTARENQPQLRQAKAASDAASARADQARASLLPQVSASASYERATANSASRSGVAGSQVGSSSSTYNSFSLDGTVSQLVYDFGKTGDRWSAAKASARAQSNSEQYTSVQALLGVRTAFFAARAAKDLVTVARDTLANQDAHLRQIQGFVKVGTRPEIDLAQARTDRANAQVQAINAENTYETAKAELNQAMGVEGPTSYDVADETLPPVKGEDRSLDELLPEALQNRPDVTSVNEQLQAQQASIGSAKGGYWPSLGVSTGINNSGPALDSTVWNWNAKAALTWDIFEGGLTRAQVEEAQANLTGLEAQAMALRQQVRLDVDQARLAVRANKAGLSAADEALANARERLRLAEGRYKTGNGSAIELGDAQVASTAAAAQKVQAQYNLSTSRAQLLRALGRAETSGR